jgi:hypothetical protein
MRFASRKIALAVLFGFALAAAGCGSNNKGKIEGKWKIVSMPEKAQGGKNEFAEMAKLGIYVYMEFRPDGTATFGVGADKPEMMDLMAKGAGGKKLSWDLKYKLLSGDGVEFYDLPKDLQTEGGGGLFGKKDRARANVKISGDQMKMTDDEGTATLQKMQ